MRKFLNKHLNSNLLPKILFVFSLCALSFAYGYLAYTRGWFPNSMIREAIGFVKENTNEQKLNGHYVETKHTTMVPLYDEETAYNGLTLITAVIENDKLAATVVDMEGKVIHRWEIDWFDIWPDPTHISKSDSDYPKDNPGTHIHGAVLLDNGDLIFNFDHLGMVRLDVCGNVIWRLPYRTHHSIFLDENANLWVPGQINHDDPLPDIPSYKAPFIEPTILKVSLDGNILKEISVFDLLQKNELFGLLYIRSIGSQQPSVSGDALHLNDVEIFPSDFEEGVFKTGDIMISLRNVNTILVFREDDLKVKFVSTGSFVRQHDPDFIDGNTISVYDNFSFATEDYGNQSRILIESYADGQEYIYYSGSESEPFFSSIMGKHQWLPNGNLLITETKKGRVFEIDNEGNIVWEYINVIGGGIAGIVEQASRLPDFYTEDYFTQITNTCITKLSD